MKFSGKIGFWIDDMEVSPGVWKSGIIEKPYTGDILRNTRRWENRNEQIDSFKIDNQISVISNLFMQQNWPSIKYVVIANKKLRVTSVSIDEYPRITLTIAGDYNENANAAGGD